MLKLRVLVRLLNPYSLSFLVVFIAEASRGCLMRADAEKGPQN
jgi:hypothetical protein